MIDPDTIDEADDCDGESIHAYGYNQNTGAWEWDWIPFEELWEHGRGDIVAQFMGEAA